MRWTARLAACAAASLTVGAAAAAHDSAGDPSVPPNIVFLLADDWGRYGATYAPAGHPSFSDLVDTPTLDQLALDGVVFENAFAPAPSTTPSRGALVTGLHVWRLGRAAVRDGGAWGPAPGVWEALAKFPTILEYLGYHVGFAGALGLEDWEADRRMAQARHLYGDGAIAGFSQTVMAADDRDAAKQDLYDAARASLAEFLEARAAEDQPFFFWFGAGNTARPWAPGSGAALWGIDPEALAGRLPPDWPDTEAVRRDVADYLGEIAAFDALCQALLEELNRRGLMENTMIVAAGDNGAPGFPRAKGALTDKGVAIPLIVYWPGHAAGRRRVLDFVTLRDLAPTFIEAAGGAPPPDMDAASLVGVLDADVSGLVEPGRDHVVLARERDLGPGAMRAIRTAEYLYILNYAGEASPMLPETAPEEPPDLAGVLEAGPTREEMAAAWADPAMWPLVRAAASRPPATELYVLADDPAQMVNRAGDPELAEAEASLRARLIEARESTGDLRGGPGESPFERPPYALPEIDPPG